MSRGKPGMGKYLGSRGPHFNSGDGSAHRKFWLEDLARNAAMLTEARAAHDVRVINLAHQQRMEILAELSLHGKQEAAA